MIDLPPNGVQTAVISGTKTTGDVLTVNVYDAQLSGGSKAISYTVGSSDTLTTIATNVAAALNADTDLQGINVSATSSGTVVNILSASTSATSYTSSLSGGATETVSLAPSTSANLYSYNNLNELTSIAAGGPTRFQGGSNKALKSASVDGNAASLPNTLTFRKNASLSSGSDSVPVSVTDGSNTTVSQNYKVSTKGSGSASPTFDANGNMTSDGTNTYEWDAENRLIKINYPGSGNRTAVSYNPFGEFVELTEVAGGSTASVRRLIWPENSISEERDSAGNVLRKNFKLGFEDGGTNYYQVGNGLRTVNEITDAVGSRVTQYSYDPFGRQSVQGTINTAYPFAGLYHHVRSGLSFAKHRIYSSSNSRWLSRDPANEVDSANLYTYTGNDPVSFCDPLGLKRKLSDECCIALALEISQAATSLAEYATNKVDVSSDYMGGFSTKWNKSGKTTPFGHTIGLWERMNSLNNLVMKYIDGCMDDDDHGGGRGNLDWDSVRSNYAKGWDKMSESVQTGAENGAYPGKPKKGQPPVLVPPVTTWTRAGSAARGGAALLRLLIPFIFSL